MLNNKLEDDKEKRKFQRAIEITNRINGNNNDFNISNEMYQKAIDLTNRINPPGTVKRDNSTTINIDTDTIDTDIDTSSLTETNTQKEKAWYQDLVKGSKAFDDGYQPWKFDATRTNASTLADLTLSFTKGVVSIGESTGDFLNAAVAQIEDWTGNTEKANVRRQNIANGNTHILSNKISEIQDKYIDPNSISGNGLDKVAESAGYMTGLAVATEYGGAGLGNILMFTNGAGGGAARAYSKENVSDVQAWTEILGAGAIAYLSETSMGFFGKTGVINSAIASKISSPLGQMLVHMGINAAEEAVEEFEESFGNWLWDKAVDLVGGKDGAKFSENMNWDEIGEEMGIAFVSSLLFGGALDVHAVTEYKNKHNVTTTEAIDKVTKAMLIDDKISGYVEDLNKIDKKLEKTTDPKKKAKLELERRKIEVKINKKGIDTEVNSRVRQQKAEELSETLDDTNKKLQKDISSKKRAKLELEKKIAEYKMSLVAGDFYVSRFNNEGELESMSSTFGKVIENPNSEIDIIPAVVKNGEAYNVIDAQSGLVLDSDKYITFEEAEKGFNQKIKERGEMGVKIVNEHVAKANMAVQNKLNEITVQNNNSNMPQTNENEFTDTLNNEVENYTPDKTESLKNQFSENETYSIDDIANIWQNLNEADIPVQYDSDGNFESYIGFDENENHNVVVNKYDSDSNLIGSIEIPQTKGKYTAQAIRDTIDNVLNNTEMTEEAEVDASIESDVKDIKKRLKTTKLNVSSIKSSISDYNDFRKSNYGRLNLGNDGMDIDTFYKELASDYPQYFDESITNPADQLQAIVDWRNETADKLTGTNKDGKNVKSEKNYTGNSALPFEKQVDKWKNGEFSKDTHLVLLKETPKLYQDLGLDNLPITLVANKLERIYYDKGKQKGEYHGLGEKVKELPRAIENPLNIVESTTNHNSIVIVTDLEDKNGNIVILSMSLNGKGQLEINNVNKNIKANVVTSAYGRENYDRQKREINGDFKGWMEQNFENGRIIYDIDEGIIKRPTNGQRLQLPNPESKSSTTNTNSSSINNIIPHGQTIVNGRDSDIINKDMQKKENNSSDTTRSLKNNNVKNDSKIGGKNVNISQNIVSDKKIVKSLENYQNSKRYADRKDILNIANNLNVYHRGTTFIDSKMQQKAGNNNNPKLIKIDEFFKEYTDKEDLRKQAYDYAIDNYKNETVKIRDVNSNVDISQAGIKKTFGKNQDNNKMQTANNLLDIIEEGIYLNSSKSTKNSNLIYHYFYTPISIDGENQIALITIREDTTNKNDNHKFYYHDIREIKNIEKGKAHAMPHENVSNMLFEQFPSQVNNIISQRQAIVNSRDSDIINNDMQKSKNNSSDTTRSLKKNTVQAVDNQGRKLTKEQQEFFKDSKILDRNGLLMTLYHGTNNEFNVFDKSSISKNTKNAGFYGDGFYFTPIIESSKLYGKNIKEVYLNITNPFSFSELSKYNGEDFYSDYVQIMNLVKLNPKWGKIPVTFSSKNTWNDIYTDVINMLENNNTDEEIDRTMYEKYGEITEKINDRLYIYSKRNNYKTLSQVLKEKGYDGIINSETPANSIEIVAFNSNQIKNVDNTNPTSSDDIRYMKKAKSTTNQKTLIAQHNVNEEKILEALELGALPVPSIAITKGDTPMLGYGGITLLFDKDTINPTDKRNVAYNSDIYSTRKPQIGNVVNKTKFKKFEKVLQDNGISYGYVSLIREGLEENDFLKVQSYLKSELRKPNGKVNQKLLEDLYTQAIETIQEKRIMRTDIEPYTPSGNRRTIEQMSLPYTLDNIVSLMTKKNTKGSESDIFSGFPEVRANTSQKFKSIDKMHQKENNIINEAEMLKVKQQLRDEFYNIIDKIEKYDTTKRYFGNGEVVANALNETAKAKNITKEVLENELDFVSINDVPDELLQEAIDFLNGLKNAPTEYFESKPQRAVGFDEVKKAIIPEDTSKELVDKLKEHGIKIEKYSTDEERKKLISNSEDIRFAKKVPKQEEGLTNAQRADAWIEQEINKIEQTGKWDNSIPVTRLTDIRKTIEDYLGLGIKKGHFRQQAYGIYKGNRDVIRTKEYKDIDTILHETGHALDIGNRLKLDKEAIADELLTAISKLDGYEVESRSVKLEEGFAEVIREYSIVPEQAKKDYPQAVAVIEKIRQNDSSFDKFMSKVQQQTYNYIHQNPQNRVHSNISIGEQTDKAPLTKAWLEQEVMRIVWDKDYSVKKVVSELSKINDKTVNQLKASDNAYYLTRLASGISDKAISMLADGYIDNNGNKIMPGLNQVGEILGDDPQRYNDWRDYLVAKRDPDYKAKKLITGIRNNDTQFVLDKFKNDTQIQQAAQVVYDTLDGVMQYAVDNGLISSVEADKLKQSNAFYVPMQRVIERRGNQVGRKGAVTDIIKKRTGSELDIKDVLENIVTNSANIIQQVENNNVLKALYKQGESTGMTGAIYDVIPVPMMKVGTANLSMWENELKKQGVDTSELDLEKTIDLFAPNNKIDTKNLITSFINDNGNRVYLQFNDEILFNSLMNMDKKFMSQVLQINSKLNMPLRLGATMGNVGFAIPNMISDTLQATVYSQAGFIPVIDNALGVLDVLTANNKTVREFVKKYSPEYVQRIENMYNIYKQTGATNSTRLSQYRETTQNVMKDIYGTRNSETLGIDEKYKPLKRLLDIMTYIPELSEQSTRFRVFEKNYDYYKEKGNSEMDTRILAALESRDATQDFGRTGNLTREINQLIPFSAARVGSAYTFTEKMKANPQQTAMRLALLTVLAMAIKGLGYDDDEIEELNQRKKDDTESKSGMFFSFLLYSGFIIVPSYIIFELFIKILKLFYN